jgi:hypothetical protein
MNLRFTARDRSGPVIDGRRFVSLPLRVYVAVLALGLPGWSAADPGVVPYTGARGNAISLTRGDLRDIFFARQTKWAKGNPIRVFVLPDRHPLHIRFSKEVLGVYPYQLRATWDRILFSGTGVPPTVVNTPEEIRERVDAMPGAIGYTEE